MEKPAPFFAALLICLITNTVGLLLLFIPLKFYDRIVGGDSFGATSLLIFYLVLFSIPVFLLLWLAIDRMARLKRPGKDHAREVFWILVVLLFLPFLLFHLSNILAGEFGSLAFITSYLLALRLSVWCVFQWPEAGPPNRGDSLDANL